jgi:hypothetical protein
MTRTYRLADAAAPVRRRTLTGSFALSAASIDAKCAFEPVE